MTLARVMVTGGAGFIGSALCRLLVAEGTEVLNVDKLTYAANLKSLDPVAGKDNYRFLKADIGDGAAMAKALAEFRPDAVIHLAAESHVDRSITGSISSRHLSAAISMSGRPRITVSPISKR